MHKRKYSKRRRSLAAKKGWVTRRRNARREFLRRSRAAKKGWRRRKAKAKIAKAAAQPLAKGPKAALREWLVTWIYKAQDGPPRQVDFTVIARNSNDALLSVLKAVDSGHDSQGADLSWMTKIPWDESFAVEVERDNATLSKDEIKALGEGYVAVN
jgi:hypothetical protein